MGAVSETIDGSTLLFWKVEGLGNDFLLVDWSDQTLGAIMPALGELAGVAPRVCDRRLGVGGDGILVVGPGQSDRAASSMWVINHDGSQPEMCGNGLRCVAHHVARRMDARVLVIDTDAGPRACQVELDPTDPGLATVAVSMGQALDLGQVQIVGAQGRRFRKVSTGNPHAVCFVGKDENPEALAREFGPLVERDPNFPQGTNVEFAQIREDQDLRVWVWERGCGITEACGTGACATLFAAHHELGLPLGSERRVHLPGGPLVITLPSRADGQVRMCGPARHVFQGQIAAATSPSRSPQPERRETP
jgi:diaminopimelate epimerase